MSDTGDLIDRLPWHPDAERVIGCGPGWYDLIDFAHRRLSGIGPYQLYGVRQKYGKLVYGAGPAKGLDPLLVKRMTDVVEDIAEESTSVCEVCGENGALNDNPYALQTRCEIHWEDIPWTE